MIDCCQLLEWDTAFFGFRIARLVRHRLSDELAQRCLRWCAERQVRCLYFLADADDPETLRVAQRYGFRLVDIRITLEHNLQKIGETGSAVRPCRESDLGPLKAIAAQSHRESRFYYDGGFPRERCDALYMTWIERSFRGYAQTVLVAERNGQPVGYVTCHLSPDGRGSIGLLGVSAEVRGKGVGGDLVKGALAYFCEQGMRQATVVTQGRNIPAQRLYQKQGFLTESVQLWFHLWFERSKGGSTQ